MTPVRITRSLAAVLGVLALVPASAVANWNSDGSGSAFATARSVAAGNTPTASVSNRSVTLNWTATGGEVPITTYIVKRYSTGGAEQTVGASCSGTVTGTSCTETSVPPGTWRYSVTPVRENWRGAESAQSTAATVSAPALNLSPTSVNSLPATLTGEVTNFVPGQTVTFRLDNQDTGQVLTATVTPSPVPASGTSRVTVTLPTGVADGAHTIYAVGSGSDVASTNVTVAALPRTTVNTTAYDIRDASAGAGEVNVSESIAIPGDARTTATSAWATSFSPSRYVVSDLNSPLRADSTITSGTINVRFQTESTSSPQGCFYLEARKASDNSLLSTYGSATVPYCTSAGLTQTSFAIPFSGTLTPQIANDMRFQIYGRTSNVATAWRIDEMSLSVTGSDGTFTLYPDAYVDAASGTSTGTPWLIARDDNVVFTNAAAANWQTTYVASRYLKTTFPAYVPAGATVTSATLTHDYRSFTAARTICTSFQIYAGASLIGSHPASGDQSCNSSNVTDVKDTISLPEVDTVAEANSLSARIFVRRTGTGTTQSRHDQVLLSVTYTK